MTTTYESVAYTAEEVEAHRKEWVAALRSGRYNQTMGLLHDGHGYCCLGVACELAGLPKEYDDADGEGVLGPRYLFDGEPLTLPVNGQNWLGVVSGNPSLDIPYQITSDGQRLDGERPEGWTPDVASLNDGGFTFNQIADLIEYFGFQRHELAWP